MGIQDYDCPQESVLIDTHEGYALSDRKKTRKRKIAQFINNWPWSPPGRHVL